MPELGWAGVLPFAWRDTTPVAFEAFRDGHRWVWLDDQGYDVDGSGQGKVGAASSAASKGPQKVTIPMSGLALGASHNVTVALVGTEGRVLVSDSLLFRLPA